MEAAGASGARPETARDPRSTSWKRAIDDVLGSLGVAAGARMRVLRLEARRARRLSVAALLSGVFAALMMLTAWFALVGAIVTWAVAAGFRWPWVLSAVAVACLLLGWLGVRSARAAAAAIRFDGTARALRPSATRSAPTTEASR